MQDLLEKMRQLSDELDQSIKVLRKNGYAACEAERDYQIAKNQTALKMKAEGLPATLIQQILKGDKEVAQKMFQRDIAKVLYDTNREHLLLRKAQYKQIGDQIEREWKG